MIKNSKKMQHRYILANEKNRELMELSVQCEVEDDWESYKRLARIGAWNKRFLKNKMKTILIL